MSPIHFAPYVLLVTFLLSACGAQPRQPQPPEIVYGQDVCEGCGMIIGEAKFAAATILTDGTARKFDDIGDMLIYHLDHPEAQVKAWFVHDYQSETWLRGETAFFVKGDLMTPMGGRIAAFENKTAAETYAAELISRLGEPDLSAPEHHLVGGKFCAAPLGVPMV